MFIDNCFTNNIDHVLEFPPNGKLVVCKDGTKWLFQRSQEKLNYLIRKIYNVPDFKGKRHSLKFFNWSQKMSEQFLCVTKMSKSKIKHYGVVIQTGNKFYYFETLQEQRIN